MIRREEEIGTNSQQMPVSLGAGWVFTLNVFPHYGLKSTSNWQAKWIGRDKFFFFSRDDRKTGDSQNTLIMKVL